MTSLDTGAYPNRNYTNTQILLYELTKIVYLCNCDLQFGPQGPLMEYFCDQYRNTQIFVRLGPIHVMSSHHLIFQQEVKNSCKGTLLHFLTCRRSRRHQGSRTSRPPGAAAVTADAAPRCAHCCHQGRGCH